jgi:hypothetical protein
MVTIQSLHIEGGSFGLLLYRFSLCLLLSLSLLVLLQFFPVGRLFKLFPVILLILLLTDSKLMLDLGDECSDFLFGDFILSQDVRVLLIELLGCFVRVGMED